MESAGIDADDNGGRSPRDADGWAPYDASTWGLVA
jgi:hypothetical protein